MDLTSFIEKHGDAHCAALFDAKIRTVASWRRRERFPRPEQAALIVERSGGVLDMDAIYRSPEQKAAA